MDTFRFSQASLEMFEDDDLANLIYQFIKGKNYFMLQWFGRDDLLRDIQAQFPFVVDIQLQREESL